MPGSPSPDVLWRLYEGAVPTDCELRAAGDQWAISVSYRGKSVFRGRYASQRAAVAHADVLRANLLANGWQGQAVGSTSDRAVEGSGIPDTLYGALVDRVGVR